MYQKIDKDDPNRCEIMKFSYMEFLHKSAIEQNLYKNRIKQSLDSIYSKSLNKINLNLAQLSEADITKINLQIDPSVLDEVPFTLLSGIGDVITVKLANMANMERGFKGWTKRMMEIWTEGFVLKNMAADVRKSVIDHDLFQMTYQNLIDILKISDRSSS